MTLGQLQQRIRELYGDKDARRGVEGTFMWFVEEVGELSAALRGGTHDERVLEFADVLAWLATLANNVGVDLDDAIGRKYGAGCPGCGRRVLRQTSQDGGRLAGQEVVGDAGGEVLQEQAGLRCVQLFQHTQRSQRLRHGTGGPRQRLRSEEWPCCWLRSVGWGWKAGRCRA